MSDRGRDSAEMDENSEAYENPLSVLQVFDSLEVGPVKLEPQKLTMPYKLFSNGQEDTTELVYSYEEDVFDKDDIATQNLASMIGAQVALNYGLFCRRIIFRGTFDDTDRRYINDMAENTAREIYVKKFLESNPFLTGGAGDLPVIKKQHYLAARLEFPDFESKLAKMPWHYLSAETDRHCILSSGGKDSLLTYGLLSEIGKEIHPIFVNESGRHWFTALNAYRHFKGNIPNTARVWVNSDRVFNWMLRHMPFIRKDYSNMRADEYPLRLWTVAVFLFGALPIMRKRGIGRLLIGDEYDTTDRTSFKGITHYNGVYDQSRYFDDACSRYYMRKGWDFTQFSILRPLSELLIEKILARRYPDLQELQVSCHAAHEKDKRVYPCGKCEKCRRIVGMLTAIDSDPHNCGYDDQQIRDCLQALGKGKLHQEAPGVEHLAFLLNQKGLVQFPEEQKKLAKEHPVIMKLRFHFEKSPMDSIPNDLRQPLYRIFLEYTDGAVRRVGRKWIDIDPFMDPSIIRPYPFEMAIEKKYKHLKKSAPPMKNICLWAELTWPEAEKRLQEIDVAILPVGAIEQHGPHLTLDIDSFDADYLAKRVAEACSDPKPLVLPLLPYGVSYHHDKFKGTLSVSNETLARMVYEIGLSVAKNGINKLVIINGHGGNDPALNYAAQRINRDAKIFTCVDTGETSDVDIVEFVETPNDVHAGEFETSTSLAVRPYLVKMDLAKRMVPEFSSRYLNFTSKRGVSWYAHTENISPTGVMGDPTKASAEKGRKMWEIMIAHLVAFVEDLKSMTLDEIYQRRY